jgi:hypothetical protein
VIDTVSVRYGVYAGATPPFSHDRPGQWLTGAAFPGRDAGRITAISLKVTYPVDNKATSR